MTDVETFGERLRRQAREAQEIRLAGLWGMTYTRAAMDPRYATPEALDRLVATLLSTRLPGCAELAAAAITGWVQGHPDPVCNCPHEKHAGEWDDDEQRWRHPVTMRWSWSCPVERHRTYAEALSRRAAQK